MTNALGSHLYNSPFIEGAEVIRIRRGITSNREQESNEL